MSNSPLVAYANISPNRTSPRAKPIDRITPHCVVGQLSCESICGCFTSPSRQASCNYGIGVDGRVAMAVEEKDRSWCSSSGENDHRAVTIECASDKTVPYAMNEKVHASLIDLCVDICERNGKKWMLWLGDKQKTLAYSPAPDEMVITVHRWFANKSCPGDWLYSRLGDLAAQVTARLNTDKTLIIGQSQATVEQMRAYIKKVNPSVAQSVLDMIPLYITEGGIEGVRGDIAFAQSCLETGNFTFKDTAVTLDQNNFCGMGVTERGMKGNSFATPQEGIRAQIQHLKAYATADPLAGACIDPRYKWVEKGCAPYVEWLGQKENPAGKGWAAGERYGEKMLNIMRSIIDMPSAGSAVPFLVKTDDQDIFPEPPVGRTGPGTFTIVEVQGDWGRLKSGAGWICLKGSVVM